MLLETVEWVSIIPLVLLDTIGLTLHVQQVVDDISKAGVISAP